MTSSVRVQERRVQKRRTGSGVFAVSERSIDELWGAEQVVEM
jgi:hypothetical protein